ncbi:single-stranded DNA-binding protein [Patescibacteria group bacterium]|nr:single-stranded DNA-binding protein [Patescibacteria group bacterium]MBU0777149.1 single-stranded DNA-binding protein [Patescibacteria group bacterium]MBU0845843.1 single-stranded DNA-binding protein [Patescibacteria group bacterium]MBU0922870.1 single-stranded DNA-binding protein [Patescibacteria group bacterium]MBU1066397.1 single-stranded DNA-binding protein [Patescibacteria group bacterium]
MSRSLNKVSLIGNLTRDPELRFTPQGTAVCTFGLATNRQWTTESGEKKEDVEFHKIVAWTKLAELCAQLLTKGRKAYVEGRLQTRSWDAQDGAKRTTTEIVISSMIILDSKRGSSEEGFDYPDKGMPEDDTALITEEESVKKTKTKKTPKDKKSKGSGDKAEIENEEDIPF